MVRSRFSSIALARGCCGVAVAAAAAVVVVEEEEVPEAAAAAAAVVVLALQGDASPSARRESGKRKQSRV